MTDLEIWLAVRARALGLGAATVEEADAEVLREYCRQVLAELVARGLLSGDLSNGDGAPGCYAAPRPTGN